MRGTSDQQIESLVIKRLADRVLQELSPTFSRMYAKGGDPPCRPYTCLPASPPPSRVLSRPRHMPVA